MSRLTTILSTKKLTDSEVTFIPTFELKMLPNSRSVRLGYLPNDLFIFKSVLVNDESRFRRCVIPSMSVLQCLRDLPTTVQQSSLRSYCRSGHTHTTTMRMHITIALRITTAKREHYFRMHIRRRKWMRVPVQATSGDNLQCKSNTNVRQLCETARQKISQMHPLWCCIQ
jgi:hypothetical protein